VGQQRGRIFATKHDRTSTMKDEPQDIQATLLALQTEMAEVRARLSELEKVVDIDVNEDGTRQVYINCTDFVVRPAHAAHLIALHLGANEDGGYLELHYPEAEVTAVSLAIEDGLPHIQIRGRDCKLRADTFIHEDTGMSAVFSTGGVPGALMRARAGGGGSVAVLQADGRARGVLVHDASLPDVQDGNSAPTELIMAGPEGKTVLKLRADDGGGMITVGPPGQPDAAALVARENGPALLLHSPDQQHSVSIIAADQMAEVCAHEGAVPEGGSQASLSAGSFGSSVVLKGVDGKKGADMSVLDVASTLSLHDEDGQDRLMLAHHFGSHTALSVKSAAGHDAYRVLATKDVTSHEIVAPADSETKILAAVTHEKPVTLVQKSGRPILMFGEGELGGILCAYGPAAQHAGIATLSGGLVSGSLALATVDGIPQLTLDATDHGGRLLINNDIGFQRIAMGVYQEAAGLHLNNTGSIGVQAVATPKGGVVTVSDMQGRVVATLPDHDEDDSASWGRLPDGF